MFCIAVVEASANDKEKDLEMYINDPKSKRLTTLDNAEVLRHHFAAFYAGNYQICLANLSPERVCHFNLMINSGIEATDYSNLVQKKHLNRVELSAQKVTDMIEQIRNDLTSLLVNEENLK